MNLAVAFLMTFGAFIFESLGEVPYSHLLYALAGINVLLYVKERIVKAIKEKK